MGKFLFIGKDEGKHHRGAHSIGKRFAEEYSDWIDYKEEKEIEEELPQNYKKYIFLYQIPKQYSKLAVGFPLKNKPNT